MASNSSISKQALVFGASGIGGWAVARECLVYPSKDTFASVVALAKQPLGKEQFFLGEETISEKLHAYGGIDLLDSGAIETFGKIPDIEKTTHVFYAAYAGHNEAYSSANPFEILNKINIALLKGSLAAVTKHCPALQSWVLLTGSKAYGFELLGVPGFLESVGYATPLQESRLPLPSPWYDMIFYNNQRDELINASNGKSWTFTEVMPDLVIGYAPRTNPMCFAQSIGLFLSFYRDVHGVGAEVLFPGPLAVYNSKHSDTSQDISARFQIFVGLNSTTNAKQRLNISDNDEAITFGTLWPELCKLFGLKGLPPKEDNSSWSNDDIQPQGAKWVLSQSSQWSGFERRHCLLPGTMESTPWLMLQMTAELTGFDRQLDISAAREMGFSEKRPTIEAYEIAFQRLRSARIMP